MKISLAIPTYHYNGNGFYFLSHLLNSIIEQDYANYEVIISDQGIDSNEKIISKIYSNKIDIKYFYNNQDGMGNNFNNAIKNCTGDIIKIMCGDDYFIDPGSLSKIANKFKENKENWLLSGCLHSSIMNVFYDRMIPRYHDQIHLGANTISSPSVLSFRNKEYFDENLVMLLDCEMYKRLYQKYGQPMIISDALICNRMHREQAQNHNSNLLEKEKIYCVSKYGN